MSETTNDIGYIIGFLGTTLEPAAPSTPPQASHLKAWILGSVLVVVIIIAIVLFYALNPPLPQTANIRILEAQPGICPTNNSTACRFSPSSATVPYGGSAIWFNTGKLNHTITWMNISNTGAKPFSDSDLLQPNAAFILSHIQPAGTFRYHCRIHPWITGSITVV